ncbi:MAG: DUF3649 domain-containing protein [Pseudomonadota bacterium]
MVSSGAADLAKHANFVIGSRTFRTLLAVFGGYAFTSGYFAFLSVTLANSGVSRAEAMWWGVLTSFLVYTLIVIWVAGTTRPWLACTVVIGGSVALIAISPALVPQSKSI